MTNLKKELEALVRDLTKVGSIPKSEARQRIQEYAEFVVRECLDKDGNEIDIAIQNVLAPYFIVLDGRNNDVENETIIELSYKIRQEILAAKDKFNLEI